MIANIKIAVTTVAFSKNTKLVNNLRSLGFKMVAINETGKRFSKENLIEFLKGCDGAIVGLDKIDESVLSELPDLKVIAKYGVGLDNINLADCKKHSVQVVHTQGVNRRSVSEMALGFMLGLSRNLYVTSNKLKEGTWDKSGGSQLSNKVVGIIGIGHIGKDLISLLKPFNCKILVNDIIDQTDYYKEHELTEASKSEIYKNADFITIHTPLTEKTKHLLNTNTFLEMKTSAVVINTARGGIVNQDDLKVALNSGQIRAAAIDAYEEEPPRDADLIKIPNLMNTPHIGGNSQEAVNAMGEASIDNLMEHFKLH